MMKNCLPDTRFWVRQDDIVITQANPVSTTVYPVVTIRGSVGVHSVYCETTGGTVQEMKLHCDTSTGHLDFVITPPVSGTPYYARRDPMTDDDNQLLSAAGPLPAREFLVRDKFITIGLAVTWTVQPTPLECRVKWSRYI